MRYIQVSLDLHEVGVREADDVLTLMSEVATQGAEFYAEDRNTWLGRIVPQHQWEASVRHQIEDYMAEKGRLWKWVVDFRMQFGELPELYPYFRIDVFGHGATRLEIGELLDFEFKDQRHLVEPTVQRLLMLARALYHLARPVLGYIEEGYTPILSEEVAKLRFKHISWANWFGTAYVQKYGRDFLLGLPGYKTEALPDGGVFHQLSPNFVATSQKEARELRRQVVTYCAQRGLKVSCTAPYYIPGLSPEPPRRGKGASDAVVRAFLKDALATTLVLTDGTRVKPIHIPWDTLTPRQRNMAIEAIKQAAIAEIKRPERAHIRLELNEIPDELDRMLAALAGRDNPDFEWVQVDMGPHTE